MACHPAVIVATVCVSAGLAAAEPRAPALSVEGGFAVHGPLEGPEPEGAGYLGATLAWDRPAPAYPASRGYELRGDIVPEVTLARFDDRSTALLGVRFELDYAQKEMGLLRVSARGSMWIAPRFGVISGADSTVAGLDLGTSYLFGRSGWSAGYWFGLLTWREAQPRPPVAGVIFLDPSVSLADDSVIALTGGLLVGRAY